MTSNKYLFESSFVVRDYECDLQGVVNNANYQHYLEHNRHEYLISRGIGFAQLHAEGVDLIVTHIEIDYKYPLRSLDNFVVRMFVKRHGTIRINFIQDIYRLSDDKLIAKAIVTCAAIKNGRPIYPSTIMEKLGIDSEDES